MQKQKAYEHSHYRSADITPAFPARWFYGFLRALPGDLAFLPPSSAPMQSILANLTPALACQDHTTSPSAHNTARQSMCRVHRIPRSTSVTIAKRPSYRARDGRACRDDLPDRHSGIFLRKGLDSPNQLEIACDFNLFAQERRAASSLPASDRRRHCERSEAIQNHTRKLWIASSLRSSQ
jgi:hypothetical protein